MIKYLIINLNQDSGAGRLIVPWKANLGLLKKNAFNCLGKWLFQSCNWVATTRGHIKREDYEGCENVTITAFILVHSNPTQNPVKEMESMQEMIPFAKEMWSQKPSRGMVKVYVVGTALAFFGVVIGLVETVCQSLSPREPMDEDLSWLMAREHLLQEQKIGVELTGTSGATKTVSVSKQQVATVQRNTATRLHASWNPPTPVFIELCACSPWNIGYSRLCDLNTLVKWGEIATDFYFIWPVSLNSWSWTALCCFGDTPQIRLNAGRHSRGKMTNWRTRNAENACCCAADVSIGVQQILWLLLRLHFFCKCWLFYLEGKPELNNVCMYSSCNAINSYFYLGTVCPSAIF